MQKKFKCEKNQLRKKSTEKKNGIIFKERKKWVISARNAAISFLKDANG